MPPDLTQRPVTAPVKDWLTEEEVCVLLGNVSDTTLKSMIRARRWPRGVRWPNGKVLWPWGDYVWWLRELEIGDRLSSEGAAGANEGTSGADEGTSGNLRKPR